jgi:transcriptional regulator with XRE-family HTH domain
MPKIPLKPPRPNFIKDWRKSRNLTLEKLVDRLEGMFGYETTQASLSRIERSEQPYSQPILEALADALGCEPADLIMRPPDAEQDIRLVWSQLSPENRRKALEIIKVLRATG